uniref:NADH-ubiquinone oxidoreductase chain 6 n=1 Tax=Mogannia minuta TaxID=2170271 RepID=A0A344ALU0_9HEMI|nr:NADH dehydrogenase subunit 6 [Mogannia minuta]
MKLILTIIFLISINFLFMKHPLSMGSLLLLQTILSCSSCMYYSSSYMFSYILFLIFVGGMLILFLYMSSIASNEKFYFSMKLFMFNFIMLSMWNMFDINLMMKYFLDKLKMIESYNDCFMYKLYMMPTSVITIFLVIYLLFTLIVVINMISLKMSSLRSSK